MANPNLVLPRGVSAAVTAAGTLPAGKHNRVDATGGALTMTLPAAAPANSGASLSVEKADSTSNAVAISGSIRGAISSLNLTSQFESVEFVADVTGSWYPVAGHKTKAALDAAYGSLKVTVAPATATQSIAASTSYDITGVTGQATTFTLPAAALGQQITLILRQPASGSAATWVFPAATHWPNGQQPVFSLINGAEDQVSFYGMANGAWLGIFGATNASPVVAPNAPINVYAAAKPGQVTLQWLATSPGGAPLQNYAILRSTTTGTETQIATASASSTTYTDSTATNGTTYFYKVAAVTSAGQATSTEVVATPKTTVAYPDATSNNRPLTVNGTVYSVPSPVAGSSLAAQGDGSTGYLSAGNTQTALGIGGTNPWTIEGWMRKGRAGVLETPIGSYTASGARQLALLSNANNTIQAFAWNSAGASVAVGSVATITDTAVAHHVAIAFDGTYLYVALDGVVAKSAAGPTGGVNASYTGNLMFGADNNGTGNVLANFSSATFDELRVSNVARYTAAYTVPTAPLSVDANTTGLWHLDAQA